MALFEMKNITKDYLLGKTIVHALKTINLEIEEGEFTAIWGPSGSGKTTLLNLIGTIDHASSGDLFFKGDKIDQLSDNAKSELRNHKFGFIFQTFNLIPVLSAVENVMLPLQIMGKSASEAEKEAIKRLGDVDLENTRNHRPDKMSGGQRQRVAIARALITKPSIILADEPTANLDLKTSGSIIDIMKKINRKERTTFIFSTHDQRLLNRMDRLIQLEDGRIVNDIKTNTL